MIDFYEEVGKDFNGRVYAIKSGLERPKQLFEVVERTIDLDNGFGFKVYNLIADGTYVLGKATSSFPLPLPRRIDLSDLVRIPDKRVRELLRGLAQTPPKCTPCVTFGQAEKRIKNNESISQEDLERYNIMNKHEGTKLDSLLWIH